jgi:regulator of PEP synthase PpsR (kinase-PPPase family)
LVSIPTWQNAVALSIQPEQLHNYRDTTELNSHIRNNTSFASWEEIQETAVQEWTAKKMGWD